MRLSALIASALVLCAGAAFAQDAAQGEKTFRVCRTCHQIGETAKNFVGPVLNGVVGRKAGTYPGYDYSEANKTSGLTWDHDTLKDYLRSPRAKVPGTKMTFAGFERDRDIENVIAYLNSFGPDGKRK